MHCAYCIEFWTWHYLTGRRGSLLIYFASTQNLILLSYPAQLWWQSYHGSRGYFITTDVTWRAIKLYTHTVRTDSSSIDLINCARARGGRACNLGRVRLGLNFCEATAQTFAKPILQKLKYFNFFQKLKYFNFFAKRRDAMRHKTVSSMHRGEHNHYLFLVTVQKHCRSIRTGGCTAFLSGHDPHKCTPYSVTTRTSQFSSKKCQIQSNSENTFVLMCYMYMYWKVDFEYFGYWVLLSCSPVGTHYQSLTVRSFPESRSVSRGSCSSIVHPCLVIPVNNPLKQGDYTFGGILIIHLPLERVDSPAQDCDLQSRKMPFHDTQNPMSSKGVLSQIGNLRIFY